MMEFHIDDNNNNTFYDVLMKLWINNRKVDGVRINFDDWLTHKNIEFTIKGNRIQTIFFDEKRYLQYQLSGKI
jgi:hypothetical protein